MYNTFPYNTAVYNSLPTSFSTLGGQSDIQFNDYDLQGATVVSSALFDQEPTRDFQTSPIPRNDGEFILGDFFRGKTIEIRGILKANTECELLAAIDDMKKNLSVREGNLDIKYCGVVRRFKATLINGDGMFQGREHYHITFIPYVLQFLVVEPFGKSVDYISDEFLITSNLSFTESINNNGTVRAKPVFILNFLSASGVSAVRIENETRSETILVQEGITSGDYLKIDSEELTVTLNAISKDYSGGFPLLDTGVNIITVTITGSSAIYDFTVKHKTPYL